MSTVAVFIALGGTSYAAVMITGANIKDGTVRGRDIANGSLTGADVSNGGLTGTDLAASTVTGNNIKNGGIGGLDIAYDAITGDKVKDGSVGSDDIINGSVDSTDVKDGSIDGADIATGSVSSDDISETAKTDLVTATLPSGETERGVWGNIQYTGTTNYYVTYAVTLPIPAPVGLMDDQVNFASSDPLCADCDPTCAGTFEEPTAPAGKLCIYKGEYTNPGGTVESRGYAIPQAPDHAHNSKYGFLINHKGTPGVDLTGGYGSWAYTAA